MSFKITITETRDVVKMCGKEWKVIGSQRAEDGNGRIDVWGYTPDIEKRTTEQQEIFSQTVEVLNMPAVIRAINGLE